MANTGNTFDPATDELGTVNTDTGDWTSSTPQSVADAIGGSTRAAVAADVGTDVFGAAISVGDNLIVQGNGDLINRDALIGAAAAAPDLFRVEAQSDGTQLIGSGVLTVCTDWVLDAGNTNIGDATFVNGVLTAGPNTAGLWDIQLYVGAASSTFTQAVLVKNNNPNGEDFLPNGNAGTIALLTTVVRLDDGETVDTRMFQNNGGTAFNTFANGDGATVKMTLKSQ